MRWCITEGLQSEFSPGPRIPNASMLPRFPGQHGDGLLPTPMFPFGPVPPALQSVSMPNTAFFPAGANIPQIQNAGMNARRGRGPSSRQPVSGLGGQLEVAGVPIARWSGNKAGRGYSERERIVVGGPSSVEMGRPKGRRGRGHPQRVRRGASAGTRNVTWAVDVDKEYDRSIGYVEQPIKPNKSTNISQVREGGDGGNDVPLVARGRGDGANDMENPVTDSLGGGGPLQGGIHPHPIPGHAVVVPHSAPVHYNGQPYGTPSPEMPQMPVEPGLDKALGSQVPIILAKPGDIPVPTGIVRGRGVSVAMGGEMPTYMYRPELLTLDLKDVAGGGKNNNSSSHSRSHHCELYSDMYK